MDKDMAKALAETMAGLGNHDEQHVTDHDKFCCCPKINFFVFFDDIRCIQIFSGACTTWNPGKECGD
jgi:hypothetical protein